MNSQSFTCPICYDDKISNEFQFFSGCTHGVCKQCYCQLRNMTCPLKLCRSDISSDFSMRERRSIRTRMENDSYDRLLTFAQEIEPEDVNANAVVVHRHQQPRVTQQRTYQRRPITNNINNNNNLPRTPWDCLVFAFGGQ